MFLSIQILQGQIVCQSNFDLQHVSILKPGLVNNTEQE